MNKRKDIGSLKNKQDVDEIKESYLKGLSFHYVNKMSEVLDIALV